MEAVVTTTWIEILISTIRTVTAMALVVLAAGTIGASATRTVDGVGTVWTMLFLFD